MSNILDRNELCLPLLFPSTVDDKKCVQPRQGTYKIEEAGEIPLDDLSGWVHEGVAWIAVRHQELQ